MPIRYAQTWFSVECPQDHQDFLGFAVFFEFYLRMKSVSQACDFSLGKKQPQEATRELKLASELEF